MRYLWTLLRIELAILGLRLVVLLCRWRRLRAASAVAWVAAVVMPEELRKMSAVRLQWERLRRDGERRPDVERAESRGRDVA